MTRTVPALGPLGLGWRREIAGVIADLRPGFCEVIAESIRIRRGRAEPDPLLVELRDRGVPLVPHGVALSLGGADELEPERVHRLTACAETLDAPLVSEHIAFVRAGGIEAGHLLPVPRTREALDVLVRNITRMQDALPVPLAVENIAAFLRWPEEEYTEAEFLAALLERTGALLVLDVANVYANALNRGRDPQDDPTASATLVVTPQKLELPDTLGERGTGLAAQLYQVRSARSWGIGDLADLREISRWAAADLDADFVLINPLHASDPIAPIEPLHHIFTSIRSALFFDAIPEAGLTTGVIGLSIMLVVALLVGLLGGWAYDKRVGLRGADGPAKHSADVAVASAEKPLPKSADNPSVPSAASE